MIINIFIIDDDELEFSFWEILQNQYFIDQIQTQFFNTVDTGLAQIDILKPDVIVIDNHIPPYENANHALQHLKDTQFGGRVIVFSHDDEADLREVLIDLPNTQMFSKKDYMGLNHMVEFVNDIILQNEDSYPTEVILEPHDYS